MKKIIGTLSVALAAIWLAACGGMPAANNAAGNANSNANTNANAAKAAAAAPTKEALLELDKKANEAFMKGDSAYFEGFLSDKFASYEGGKMYSKAEMVKMIAGTKCDVKTWSLDEPQMSMIDADTAAIVYKGTFDGTCDGQKLPSPMRAASVYIRNGDKWVGAFHGEVPIVDPKNPSKPLPPSPGEKKDDKMAANSNSAEKPAAPAMDANTDALLAVEKSGWEAWKARDPKQFEAITTKSLSFVGLFGSYTGSQADTIKTWTEGKCEIKSTSVTDASGVTLSPTIGMLHFKGSADGTCDGNKITPLWGTNVYVKEGGAWKLAFGFESPS